MQRLTFLKLFTVLACLFLLNSCINVKDFGEYWNAGIVDDALVGHWEHTVRRKAPIEITKGKDGLLKLEYKTQDKIYNQVKTLYINGTTFLMMKEKPKDKGGILWAYVLQDDYLAFFIPDKERRREKLSGFSSPGIDVDTNVPTIAVLNDESMKVMEKIVAIPNLWVEYNKYKRAKPEEPQKPAKKKKKKKKE